VKVKRKYLQSIIDSIDALGKYVFKQYEYILLRSTLTANEDRRLATADPVTPDRFGINRDRWSRAQRFPSVGT